MKENPLTQTKGDSIMRKETVNEKKASKIQVMDKGIDLGKGTQETGCCTRSVAKSTG